MKMQVVLGGRRFAVDADQAARPKEPRLICWLDGKPCEEKCPAVIEIVNQATDERSRAACGRAPTSK